MNQCISSLKVMLSHTAGDSASFNSTYYYFGDKIRQSVLFAIPECLDFFLLFLAFSGNRAELRIMFPSDCLSPSE